MREHPLTARVAVNRLWQMLLRHRPRRHRRPTSARKANTQPPRAARLARRRFHGQRLGRQTPRQTNRHVVNVPPIRRRRRAPNSDASVGDSHSRPSKPPPRPRPALPPPAEFIRDSALKISGLLVDRLGGPSVNPYTPGNLWREISHYGSTPATAQTFEQDHGEKLYRRSLYTYWKRTVPPPNMVAFDAPNREICIVARPTTTTPLQALVLLNDVQFVEAVAGIRRADPATTERRRRPPPLGVRRMRLAPADRRRTRRARRTRSTRERTRYADERSRPPKNTSPTANRRATKKSPSPNTPPGPKSPRCC